MNVSPDEPHRSAPGATAVVVLAAGVGSRMRSALPKPLHPVAGLPMVAHVLRAAEGAAPERVVLVVAPGLADLAERLGVADRVATVVQPTPNGTGDALRVALPSVGAVDRVVVLFADHPLLDADAVARLVATSAATGALATVLTTVLPDGRGYGRIDRDGESRVRRIVERKDDDDAWRVGPVEVNSGMMAIDARWVADVMPTLAPSAATGELYLTDLVACAAVSHPGGTAPWPVATALGAPEVALGINDRVELAEADRAVRQRIRRRLMLAGVTLVGPETIFVDDGAAIGADTTILPYSTIDGATTIGRDCTVGPHATIARSRLGDGVVVRASTLDGVTVADGSDVGPYSHLRAGTDVGPGVHVGNFAEVKNSRLASGVKVGHFGYLGDADVGAGTNIGAGTITANFDGVRKHPTTIGERAFIGSDTILRAPVRVGDDATTGAGSVVTKDVPAGATAVGVPARVVKRRPAGGEEG